MLPNELSRDSLKHQVFLAMAGVLATLSTCKRRSVGCLIVNAHGKILASGYNGVPSGFPHCALRPCDGANKPSGTNLDLCEAIHAEANALILCHRPDEIYACYTTTSPCIHCIKMLLNTPCQHIFFIEAYPDLRPKELWLKGQRSWHPL